MAKNISVKFEHDRFFHVFNRTNNGEILFRSNTNKKYFLQLCRARLNGYVDIYAMALLGNHFHIAIKIRSKDQILKHLESLRKEGMSTTEKSFLSRNPIEWDIHMLVSKQFSRTFNSYSQAFNKRYQREGHLFHAPFKRSVIRSEVRLLHMIQYIHLNSQRHGLIADFKMDKWHSYQSILKNDEDSIFYKLVKAEATLALFNSRNDFIKFHEVGVEQWTSQLEVESLKSTF